MNDFPYLVKLKDIINFEKQNPAISVNIFAYEDDKVFPVWVTPAMNPKNHVNLLLIGDRDTTHYVYIKSLSRLLHKHLVTINKSFATIVYMNFHVKIYASSIVFIVRYIHFSFYVLYERF